MLQGFFVAGYAHRRRGAALHSQQRGVFGDEAVHLAVEIAEPLYQAVDDKRRQQLMQRRADHVAHVTRLAECRRRLAAQEVHQPLGRRVDGVAAGVEHDLLHLHLKCESGQGREVSSRFKVQGFRFKVQGRVVSGQWIVGRGQGLVQGSRFQVQGGNILQVNSDGDAAVGKRRVAARVAHAVDHLLPVGRGGRHYDATRAHAEREDTVATGLRGEAVGRRRQVF